jgi:predicted amidophosphoribosyltransferase
MSRGLGDVYKRPVNTTGATANACATALRGAGATDVGALAFARAVRE